MSLSDYREALDGVSPLTLSNIHDVRSARGLTPSKMLAHLHRVRPIHTVILALLLCGIILGTGCSAYREVEPARAREIAEIWRAREFKLTPELEDRILALDPRYVSEADIRDVLSRVPAPRIIKIRGGTQLVYRRMASFSEFLIGMGYPAVSVTDPGDGRYAYNCYEGSDKLAGMIAWYYEQEGLRPMLVGHSQGGMQVVKILHRLAQSPSHRIPLWNPLTWQAENTSEFTDPLTGWKRPVVGLVLPYASAVGAGGLTRIMPNQWDMTTRLRTIPDSVEEFTGFCKGLDLIGGDFLGYGPANHYKARSQAQVQNVWLPDGYTHAKLPETKHLTNNQVVIDWLNDYQPAPTPVAHPKFEAHLEANTDNILWAAEIWYRIKKHWVLEVQRYVRAKRAKRHEP